MAPLQSYRLTAYRVLAQTQRMFAQRVNITFAASTYLLIASNRFDFFSSLRSSLDKII